MSRLQNALIVSVIPYFLKRDSFWFEKNLKKILRTSKFQSFWQDNVLFLEKDREFSLSHFLRRLDEMGYEKVLEIELPGEWAHRGNIVDVFPINSKWGMRFEFFGNKIENIERLPIEIKDEKSQKELLKKKLKSQKMFSDLRGLKKGDYVVHLDHGVGRFLGFFKEKRFSTAMSDRPLLRKYYLIGYAKKDKLYVPVGLERKLSRYIGFSEPKISRLGSPLWQKTKRRIKKEAEKLARELLEIYARREIASRTPYQPKNLIDQEVEASFKYKETPDQVKVLEDIEKDLKKSKPMDRIVCGDVGFGKTEIALRAMVRAVSSGYMAAMICPTTILANQHFQNFKKRLENFPTKIALLSRLQPKPEQKKIIKDLKEGKIDILIGTHRILSKDVEFPKKFQFLVIDDEHRFGVKQKEKLKKMRADLDILSLSATPIPRTLYLALCSLRDISLIQTPPPGRLPISTFVGPFSKKTIKKAIEKELRRGGQVYYLHNRIGTIEEALNFLKSLTPTARLGIAHGRMKEETLVKIMSKFQQGKIDILIATTIIEAGLDFPNVNTLIVEDATKLGLAELYQIRGRIGRTFKKAISYFFYPPEFFDKKFPQARSKSSPEKVYLPKFYKTKFWRAKTRLKALKEATTLGSGYKIALQDLEMRGTGNILGKEQSGNINSVGLNLYCQMVSQAIEKLKIARPAP